MITHVAGTILPYAPGTKRAMEDRCVEVRDNGRRSIHRWTVHGMLNGREIGRTYYAESIFDAIHHAEVRAPALAQASE